jgi:anti-sigma B factor antagonist
MDLRCTNLVVEDEIVVTVSGSVDLASVGALRDHLLRTVLDAPGAMITVDLDEVLSLDDAGLGVLLGAAGRARQRAGDLRVVCTNDRLVELLRVTGADRAVQVAERF